MSKVFVAGSRAIKDLNAQLRARLDSVMKQQHQILVGDASGADKAVQTYLSARSYVHVLVYYSGSQCRNNVGSWECRAVPVDAQLQGRDFYAAKDVEMANDADFGFMIWDGKSPGTISNVLELLKRGKKSLVYFSPVTEFVRISQPEQVESLLLRGNPDSVAALKRKIGFDKRMKEMAGAAQAALEL